ncbi:MAG: glycosyltransferase [Luteolibacter sp.]
MPSESFSQNAPRIFLITKGSGMNTWYEDIAEGFRSLGCRVETAFLRSTRPAERLSQIRTKTRLMESEAVCARIAARLRAFDPDLVLILNFPGIPERANSMFRESLRGGVPILGWLCDRLDKFTKGHSPLMEGVYNFDAAASSILEQAYHGSSSKLRPLPLAASPSRYPCPPIVVTKRIPALAFAGNCTPSRKVAFTKYRELGGTLQTFGPHSAEGFHPLRNRKLSSTALGRIYADYLVSLNLLQEGNTEHGLNLRAFEIPCAGGLGTYPDVPQLADCFVPGEEVLVYRSLEELKDLVGEMSVDLERAQAISEAGHKRVMAEHTFAHRAATIISDWLPDRAAAMLPASK